MRLELVCALLVIAVVTIGASAEGSDGDHKRSVRDPLDHDEGRSVV